MSAIAMPAVSGRAAFHQTRSFLKLDCLRDNRASGNGNYRRPFLKVVHPLATRTQARCLSYSLRSCHALASAPSHHCPAPSRPNERDLRRCDFL